MKVQLPIMGRASGSSAGLIYQSYYGNTYARSFPLMFHYPNTKEQQKCQASFFDIQRVWLPIYAKLSEKIGSQQRRDINPFNKLTSYVYHIFNPYKQTPYTQRPKDWGLDPRNRLHPNIGLTIVNVANNIVFLDFDMLNPTIDIQVTPKFTHVLMMNLNQQNMYYLENPFSLGHNRIEFENSNGWKPTKNLVSYVALSADDWLGNFNIAGK